MIRVNLKLRKEIGVIGMACLAFLAITLAPCSATPADNAKISTLPVMNGALSLDQAVSLALKQNLNLTRIEQNLLIARSKVSEAKAARAVSLSTTTYLTAGSGDTHSMISGSPGVSPTNSIDVPATGEAANQDLMLMFPLWTGGKLKAALREAKSLESATSGDIAEERLSVGLAAREAYYKVLLAQGIQDAAQKQVDASAENARVAQEEYNVGKINLSTLLRYKAAIANAQQSLTTAQNDVQMALVDLKVVLGLSLSSTIQLTSVLAESLPLQPLDQLTALARKERPVLAAAKARIAASKSGISVSRAAFMPQIYLTMVGGSFNTSSFGGGPGYWAGLTIGIPLLEGGARHAKIREAKAKMEQAQIDRRSAELQVDSGVTKAWLSVQSAQANVTASQREVEQATEAERVARLRVESGKGIYLEELDALAALFQARLDRVQALYNLNTSNAELMRAIGQQ